MRLTIKTYHQPLCRTPTLGPRRFKIVIDAKKTVRDLKMKVPVAPDRQRLFYGRIELLDDETLYGYEVPDDATLILKMRPVEPVIQLEPFWYNNTAHTNSLALGRPYFSRGGDLVSDRA